MVEVSRLARDLPLIQALAAYAIEHEFGIKSQHTIWQEHTYQLAGFRPLLGEPLVDRLKQREPVTPAEIPIIPALALRARDRDQLHAFANLTVKPVAVEGGCVVLRGDFCAGRLILRLSLHFAEERLVFDPDADVAVVDDGSAEAVQCAIDQLRLLSSLLSNGQLEVWEAASGTLLGRTDPYIPVNIDLGASLRNIEQGIQGLTKLADARASTDPNPAASPDMRTARPDEAPQE